MNEDIQRFLDADGEFLCGQALADAIKAHTILRFNDVRATRIDWRPNLVGGDLSAPKSKKHQTGGLQGKLLRDPSEWKPPGTAELWDGQAHYVNFSKSDLSEANLSALDLSGANFKQAVLRSTRLERAQIRRANFNNADLSTADLRQTDLFEADFTGAALEGADLSGANLCGAKIEAHMLACAVLNGYTLLPDGEPYGGEESTWTARVDAERAEAVAEPAAEDGESLSFFAWLGRTIKSWLGS